MIGIDLVSVQRIANVKQRTMFVDRVLTKQEQEHFYRFNNKNRQNEWLAGRFALKEAIIKVIDEFISMSEIEVQVSNKKLFFLYQGDTIHCSLSHDQDYAIAVASRG